MLGDVENRRLEINSGIKLSFLMAPHISVGLRKLWHQNLVYILK